MTAPVTTPADLKAEPLIRGTIDLLRAHPVPLLVPLVLLGLLTSGGDAAGPGRFDLDGRGNGGGAGGVEWLFLLPLLGFFALILIAIVILVIVVHLIVGIVTTRAALDAIDGVEPDLGRAFRETTPTLMSGIGTGILVVLAVLLGLVLLIVPGVILAAGLLPWAGVFIREAKDGVAGLRRTWELTRGHKLDLFLVLLAGFVVSLLVSLVLGWIPIIGDAISGIVSGAISAAYATAGALFYVRRTRETPTPPVAAAPAVL